MTYVEYLKTDSVQWGDAGYDVGFHTDWDKLRLDVHGHQGEDGYPCSIDVWLTPEKARDLGEALIKAANELQQLLQEKGRAPDG